ncbi:hypothetical protein [Breznakia pachnodae]|uniref:Uncharacterized protein n=1 Tax=Breznakia pachnodae TaxID=265178 RepID=A0ABU0E538_9FIRM|nr:hypothetical protein [Breznakia pachnodae]MDQ0361819.1 hypothetical protein [Breznakia pachnodae]
MKRIILLLFVCICLTSCSQNSTDSKDNTTKKDTQEKSSETTKDDSKQENNNQNNDKQESDFDDDTAINTLVNYLKIENKDDFVFNTLAKNNDYINLEVISKELLKKGGLESVGNYSVSKNGTVAEMIVPDELIGSWLSDDHSVSYIIGYDTITVNPYQYSITEYNITAEDDTTITYEFYWDIDKFVEQYNLNINPQPVIIEYNKQDQTINTGVMLHKITN